MRSQSKPVTEKGTNMATTNQMQKVHKAAADVFSWAFGSGQGPVIMSYHMSHQSVYSLRFPVPQELMQGDEFPKKGWDSEYSFYGAEFRTKEFSELKAMTEWLRGIEKLQPVKFLTK